MWTACWHSLNLGGCPGPCLGASAEYFFSLLLSIWTFLEKGVGYAIRRLKSPQLGDAERLDLHHAVGFPVRRRSPCLGPHGP